MPLPYVRLDFDEALEAKKQLLSSQINLLTIIKRIDSFKNRRKQELNKKYVLKQELKSNFAKLNSLMSCLPEPATENARIRRITLKSEPAIKQPASKKSQNIEVQLNEIRNQLKKL